MTFFVGCAFIFPLMVIGVSYGAISCKVIRFSLPKEARGGAGRVQKPSGYKERRKNKYSFSSSSAGTKEELETGESSVDETPLRKVIIQFRCFFVDFFYAYMIMSGRGHGLYST